MKINQIYELMNDVTKEDLGLSAVINEDLSNIVDYGKEVFDGSGISYDKYCGALVDRITKMIFVERKLAGNSLALYRSNFEYGAIVSKVTVNSLPEAQENETWDLEDGASYDPYIFKKPDVSVKMFDQKVTFEIQLTLTDVQLRSAFLGPDQINSFITMLWTAVSNSLTVKMESLASKTITSFVLETLASEFPSVSDNDYSSSTGVKAINLLKLYNTDYGLTGTDALTKDNCLLNPSFVRYCSLVISKTLSRMEKISCLFNIGAKPRFTPKDKQHLVILSDLAASSKVMLESDTYHNELVSLGDNYVEVPYWQGSGTGYALSSVANIHGEIKVGDSNKEISISNVLAVAFDHDACGIYMDHHRVTSAYNAKAEFTNYFDKTEVGAFRDGNENFIVFFAA